MNISTRIKDIFFLFLFIKFGLFFIIVLAYFLLPFQRAMHDNNFFAPEYKNISLLSAFTTWDAQHYLFLADHGYHPSQESNRFYPLFPGLIHVVSMPLHNVFIAGLLTSTLVSIAAVLLFYFFIKKYFSDKIALLSTLLFLAFPTSFYISLIYSEGLFLFLTLSFFWFLYKKETFVAGLFAFFLPLTRPVGIFIVVPFGFFLLQNILFKKYSHKNLLQFSHILWPILGLLSLTLFMYIKTGNPFETFLLDKTVVGRWDVWNLFHPEVFFQIFFSFPLTVHGFTNSILDRLFFVGFLFCLPLMYKTLPRSLFIYALLMGMVPLFGNFMSYTRYILVAFPLFISLGVLFSNKKNEFFFFSFLFFSLILQTLFLIMHCLNYWVA